MSGVPVPINWLHSTISKAALPLQFIMVSSYEDEEPDAFYYDSWNNTDAVDGAIDRGAAAGIFESIDRYGMKTNDRETSLRYAVWAELYYENKKPIMKFRDADDDGLIFKALRHSEMPEGTTTEPHKINKWWSQSNLAERWCKQVGFEEHPTMDHSMGLTLGALLMAPWELVRETIVPEAPDKDWPLTDEHKEDPDDNDPIPGFLGSAQCVMNFWGQDNDVADFFLYRLPTSRPV